MSKEKEKTKKGRKKREKKKKPFKSNDRGWARRT